ncbi:hypothetical protein EC988_001036 [Linderina pennispora]|nr:hypothetical protein EC988_001036 [Linderina pennispora]
MDAQDLALRRQVRLTGTVPKQNKRVLTEREVSELPTFALTPSDITETLKVAQAGSEGHVTLAIPEPALVKEKLPLHEENCAVCLEDFRAGEQVRRLACRHYFHLQCIDPWLTAQAATCPLCNYNVATDNMAA